MPDFTPTPPILAVARPPTIVGIVGNPKPRSRTFQLAESVAQAFAEATGGRVDTLIDLVDIQGGLFAWGDPSVGAALERVFAADVLVVASPVYKATYTGLLKAFGDQISQGQLNGKLALPVMMGGADNHALAVEHELRPLLVELGATCATPGLYVLESRADERDAVAREYLERLGKNFAFGR